MRSPELVWTGPAVQGLHATDTREVYEQLLRNAERRLWVSSYAYFDGPRAFDLLSRRMDQCPGLEVTLLLNLQRPRQGFERVEPDELITRFSQRFWKHAWPGQRRPEVFFDPRALERSSERGSEHSPGRATGAGLHASSPGATYRPSEPASDPAAGRGGDPGPRELGARDLDSGNIGTSKPGIAPEFDPETQAARQRANARASHTPGVPTSPTGVLHAKAVLADDRWVFITSANLTAAAWDQNIELGLLTEDPLLATQIARHFETLIARRLLVRLP
jgi:PLD-like domain